MSIKKKKDMQRNNLLFKYVHLVKEKTFQVFPEFQILTEIGS